ncbi:uncharacterized protein [Anoplolepis gracilipes]|uniref:uncharacterized protein n=1 Tax=Anoplolepis gracilipes TaxID=354296 RepID=UPI003B9E8336
MDAIFILRQLIEKSIEFDKPMYLRFVDLKQDFDRVRLKDVITISQKHNINTKMLGIIKELNRNNLTKIKTAYSLMEADRKQVEPNKNLRYADDAILMAENKDDLQGLFQKYTTSRELNMVISQFRSQLFSNSNVE